MKFKLLVRLAEKLLGMTHKDDEPRADMYLPDFLLAMGLVLLGAGVGFGVAFAVKRTIWMILVAAGCLALGVAAVLCWKNQTIRIIDSDRFEYTTFLGNAHTYSFRDITGLRRNSDSMTLLVAGKQVHIESMAILSSRLVEKINEALEKAAQHT